MGQTSSNGNEGPASTIAVAASSVRRKKWSKKALACCRCRKIVEAGNRFLPVSGYVLRWQQLMSMVEQVRGDQDMDLCLDCCQHVDFHADELEILYPVVDPARLLEGSLQETLTNCFEAYNQRTLLKIVSKNEEGNLKSFSCKELTYRNVFLRSIEYRNFFAVQVFKFRTSFTSDLIDSSYKLAEEKSESCAKKNLRRKT
eukprot:762711-Hanusia_phi.AAC.2